MDDKSEEDELKKIAPQFFSQDKKNPFIVPENYFDSLPGMIQDKIQKKRKTGIVDVVIQKLFKPQMAFTFILLSLMFIGGIYLYNTYQKEAPVEMTLTDDDLNGYEIMDNTDETYLLDELTALNNTSENLKPGDTDIENYLIENQTDLSQIINEL